MSLPKLSLRSPTLPVGSWMNVVSGVVAPSSAGAHNFADGLLMFVCVWREPGARHSSLAGAIVRMRRLSCLVSVMASEETARIGHDSEGTLTERELNMLSENDCTARAKEERREYSV